MADVDMTDAPGTAVVKKAADNEVKTGDRKKRFEVKKVSKLVGNVLPCIS